MLKPMALAFLSLTLAGSAAALANGMSDPWSSDNDWSSVVNDSQLPIDVRNWCARNHDLCNQYEDWAEAHGLWKDDDSQGGPLPAPEIDPAGALGALTILGAVLAMMRGRRPAGNAA
jgi:hypothetical protein